MIDTAFDIKRAESIAYGFKEWIRKGQISYESAVDQIKRTYREDMAREIIRILEKELKEVEEKCRWALVFSNREEAEKARKRLSWRSIWPNDQRAERLLWINKEEAERARNHVGGLIEPWGKPREAKVGEVGEREYKWRTLEGMVASELEDEKKASRRYGDMANIAEELGLNEVAKELRWISREEGEHHNTLVRIRATVKESRV